MSVLPMTPQVVGLVHAWRSRPARRCPGVAVGPMSSAVATTMASGTRTMLAMISSRTQKTTPCGDQRPGDGSDRRGSARAGRVSTRTASTPRTVPRARALFNGRVTGGGNYRVLTGSSIADAAHLAAPILAPVGTGIRCRTARRLLASSTRQSDGRARRGAQADDRAAGCADHRRRPRRRPRRPRLLQSPLPAPHRSRPPRQPRHRWPRSVRPCPRTRRRSRALYDAAKKEGTVSWWDQHEQSVAQQFIDAFQKQFPGRQRRVLRRHPGRAQGAFGAGGPRRSGVVRLHRHRPELARLPGLRHRLRPRPTSPTCWCRPASTRQFIVDGTYSPEFTVYGAAYNTDLVKQADLPDTLDGFADPKWKGQLAIEARLRPYVYGTPFLGGDEKVVEMLSRLKANNPRPTDGDTKSQGLLVAGEFPVLVGAYLQRLIMMKDKPWGFVGVQRGVVERARARATSCRSPRHIRTQASCSCGGSWRPRARR